MRKPTKSFCHFLVGLVIGLPIGAFASVFLPALFQ